MSELFPPLIRKCFSEEDPFFTYLNVANCSLIINYELDYLENLDFPLSGLDIHKEGNLIVTYLPEEKYCLGFFIRFYSLNNRILFQEEDGHHIVSDLSTNTLLLLYIKVMFSTMIFELFTINSNFNLS